jgi:hypothetical protein
VAPRPAPAFARLSASHAIGATQRAVIFAVIIFAAAPLASLDALEQAARTAGGGGVAYAAAMQKFANAAGACDDVLKAQRRQEKERAKGHKRGFGAWLGMVTGSARPKEKRRRRRMLACTNHGGVARTTNYPDAEIRFLVVGAWGRDGFCCQLDVADEMATTAANFTPSFVANVGDSFYSHGIIYPEDDQ